MRSDLGSISHNLCITDHDIVPTPSLKTRPFSSTSGTITTISGSIARAVLVSEKACPILAAHLAGERIYKGAAVS
jgi:hypothetical protein